MDCTTGIVIIRNVLSLDEQLKFIDIVEEKGGLKDSDNQWNFFGHRGRHFSNLNKYDPFIKSCIERIKIQTENLDHTLIWKPHTHMLTLLYPNERGLGWHIDGYGGNDGDEGAPVYSLTLGNSCIFEYKLVGTKQKISVELHSGDIIIFGGPQRLMWHSVKCVHPNSFTENFNARINLTFRTCTNFTEHDEAYFQTDVYVKRLIEKKNNK